MKPLTVSKTCSVILISVAAATLSACNNSDPNGAVDKVESSKDQLNSPDSIKQHAELFEGCYKVSQDEPANIKVSQQGQGLVMQMKEPKSANRVWDDPEPLEPISIDQTSKYFSINPKNLDAMIGRPDRVLVIAKVKQAYVNIDPSLDSDYLGYIYQGANTIFKVECDDTPADELINNPHQNSDAVGNISIKPAGKVANQ